MSTDPAVAAAKRAWPYRGAMCGDPNGLALTAAREALAPIRARHRKVPANARRDDGTRVCAHCVDDRGIPELWPCADALDAYPPEEL
ncbi:hypothetical protein [Tsukamurella tyrosinosolvens]|uniref:hypothetical protein n=1 Tax=Tsukamurella tyrosinosolvens TaxID=57704 RepID=UPI002DD4408C|nr:hypothetical protein [Tsukamurella tyrosinosolvens]MEC4615819.1 hypothetical protein [Tsukamurella tyrosinosolvens]